jgi:hypothetical protein
MLLQGGKQLQQPVGEPRYVCRGDGFQVPQPDIARNDRREPPVIGTPERTEASDLQLSRVE